MNVITKTTEIAIDSRPTRNKNSKPVYCITDGKIYASVLDAAIAENVDISCISMACRGKSKVSKGKRWCFVRELHMHITEIASVTEELKADAEKYRAIEAQRRAEEERKARLEKVKQDIKAAEERIERINAEKANMLVELAQLTKSAIAV